MESYSHEICSGGIMLDPRLRNYIQYRKAYERDGIETGVPLEKMFSITKEDLRTIRKFMKGKRNFYTKDKLSRAKANFVKPTKKKFDNVDEKFRKDPHFKKLQEKMQRNKDAVAHRHNYSEIHDNYDMYEDNELSDRRMLRMNYQDRMRTPYDKMDKRKKAARRRRQNDENYKNSFLLDSHEDDLMYDNPNRIFHPERRSNMVYHNEPRISMNERLRFTQGGRGGKKREVNRRRHLVNDIIGDIDSYREKIGKHSYSHTRDLDDYEDAHRPKPETYRSVPAMYGNGLRDINADTDMRFGVNSRGGKSLGYRNPFEHQFQFIDNDLQHPDHVVNDRGIPTRIYNKSRRKYRREIYR